MEVPCLLLGCYKGITQGSSSSLGEGRAAAAANQHRMMLDMFKATTLRWEWLGSMLQACAKLIKTRLNSKLYFLSYLRLGFKTCVVFYLKFH